MTFPFVYVHALLKNTTIYKTIIGLLLLDISEHIIYIISGIVSCTVNCITIIRVSGTYVNMLLTIVTNCGEIEEWPTKNARYFSLSFFPREVLFRLWLWHCLLRVFHSWFATTLICNFIPKNRIFFGVMLKHFYIISSGDLFVVCVTFLELAVFVVLWIHLCLSCCSSSLLLLD